MLPNVSLSDFFCLQLFMVRLGGENVWPEFNLNLFLSSSAAKTA